MRTLFAKLLIWFLATILIMAIGFALFENIDRDPGPGPQRRLTQFFLHEADQIYRREGSAGLRSYLQRIESTYGGTAFLVDASGRDLASGADRTAFIRAAQEAQLPWFSRDGASFNHMKSGDGRWFFLQAVVADRGGLSASQRILAARQRVFPEIIAPERLWLMAGVLALCMGRQDDPRVGLAFAAG